jgi:hypothetical protein
MPDEPALYTAPLEGTVKESAPWDRLVEAGASNDMILVLCIEKSGVAVAISDDGT